MRRHIIWRKWKDGFKKAVIAPDKSSAITIANKGEPYTIDEVPLEEDGIELVKSGLRQIEGLVEALKIIIGC